MEKVILVFSYFFIFNIFASEKDNFEEHKKLILENMDKQISIIQNEKKCIESVSNHDGVKKCHEASKKEHDALHQENKQKRVQRIDEKIKKLQDEKSKLDEKK